MCVAGLLSLANSQSSVSFLCEQIVKFLVDKDGIELDQRTAVGITPLDHANEGCHEEMAQFLRARGAHTTKELAPAAATPAAAGAGTSTRTDGAGAKATAANAADNA